MQYCYKNTVEIKPVAYGSYFYTLWNETVCIWKSNFCWQLFTGWIELYRHSGDPGKYQQLDPTVNKSNYSTPGIYGTITFPPTLTGIQIMKSIKSGG